MADQLMSDLLKKTNQTSHMQTDKLRVFISYARADASDFAEYLTVALKQAGFDAYLDRHDISKADEWERRLGDLITKSDTIVYIITPSSIKSERCEWELNKALELNKRLVPVQRIKVPETEVPLALKRLNYTVFTSDLPFNGSLNELSEALRQDLGWLRKHTELNEQAMHWERGNRDADLLMRGTAIKEAREFEKKRNKNTPELSPLLITYIGMSEEAEVLRKDAETLRLKEIEEVQKQRQIALDSTDKAQKDKAEASKKLVHRTLVGIVVAAVLSTLAVTGGISANFQKLEAEKQTLLAKQETEKVIVERDSFRKIVAKLAVSQIKGAGESGNGIFSRINKNAIELMISFEIANRKLFIDSYETPFWPGQSAGVSIGIGYDLGYHTKNDFRKTWGPYLSEIDLKQLETAIGITGGKAKEFSDKFKNINIPFSAATSVFSLHSLKVYLNKLDKAMPGSESLSRGCAGALLSLVYNRGASVKGKRRIEMKNIRDHVFKRNFHKIPDEIRAMKRIWKDTPLSHLNSRREAEAKLCEESLIN